MVESNKITGHATHSPFTLHHSPFPPSPFTIPPFTLRPLAHSPIHPSPIHPFTCSFAFYPCVSVFIRGWRLAL